MNMTTTAMKPFKTRRHRDIVFPICNTLVLILIMFITLYPVLNTVAYSFNEAMDAVKGKEIVTLDLRETGTAVTDYFVICHANSKVQVDAIADKIIDEVRNKNGVKPYHIEGRDNTEWILIDFVDVVVHVFLQSMRKFYQLEELWADAEKIVNSEE